MPIDEQVSSKLDGIIEQITDLKESVYAQIRSLTSTINNNTVEFGQRVTTLERDTAGNAQRVHEKLEEHGDEIDALAVQLGTESKGLHSKIEENAKAGIGSAEKLHRRIDEHQAIVQKEMGEYQALLQQAKGAQAAWKVVVGIGAALFAGLEAWLHWMGK